MIKKVSKMCCAFCKSLGLPPSVCCVVFVIAIICLAKLYLLPLVEGFAAKSGKNKIVYAYMNGCPHCDDAMPEWDKFVKTTKVVDTEKIESNDDKEFMKKMGVEGFPTFLLLDSKGNKLKEYSGERTSKALEKFANENN